MSSLLTVPTRVHATVGYWGPVDATHQFCEPHYQSSPSICEYYNTVSSIVYLLLAAHLWWYASRQQQKQPSVSRYALGKDVYFQLSLFWLVVIALGSMSFHATMRYWAQLLDEIPMVGFMTTILCTKLDIWLRDSPARYWAQGMTVLYSLLLVYTYGVIKQYEIFFHGFSIMVLMDAPLGYLIPLHPVHRNTQIQAQYLGIVAILLGRVAWETENRLCDINQNVWPLHVVWHVLSCFSAYGTLMNATLGRMPKNQVLPRDQLPFGFHLFPPETNKHKQL